MNIATLTTATDSPTAAAAARPRIVRLGVAAGAVAAAVNTLVAFVADRAAISLAVPRNGDSIPVLAFGQLTFAAAVLGIGIAALLRRRASRPSATFVRISVGLAVASLVMPLVVDAAASTRILLIATHVLAAAIIIPVIARRLPAGR